MVVDTWRLLGELGRHRTGDLLLGVPYRRTGYPRLSDNGDGPPNWLASVNKGGTYFDVAAGLMKWAGRTLPMNSSYSAALRVSRSTAMLGEDEAVRASTWEVAAATMAGAKGSATSLSEWLGRAGVGLAFASGFTSQSFDDAGSATPAPLAPCDSPRRRRRGVRLVLRLAGRRVRPRCGRSRLKIVGGLFGAVGGAVASDSILDAVMPGHERRSLGRSIGTSFWMRSLIRTAYRRDERRLGVIDLTGWRAARIDPGVDPHLRSLIGEPVHTRVERAADPGTSQMTPTGTTVLAAVISRCAASSAAALRRRGHAHGDVPPASPRTWTA